MHCRLSFVIFFFFNDTATTEIYTLSLHDALPISNRPTACGSRSSQRDASQALLHRDRSCWARQRATSAGRSEEHTSELQSRLHLVCRLLLEKKKKNQQSMCRVIHAVDRRTISTID